jgi:hypothetical protein
MAFQSNFKPSRTARKIKERTDRIKYKADLAAAKREVIRRDRGCRFPMCQCRRLGLSIHAAHLKHAGMGGDGGDGATPENMVGLCFHRHQDGVISMHHGTLKVETLPGDDGTNGRIGWKIDREALGLEAGPDGHWLYVWESAPGVVNIKDLTIEQQGILTILSDMEY